MALSDAWNAWRGWGTALKPAMELIVMARKPLIGTVVANVLEHGTGALNIDACRVSADDAQAGRTRRGGRIAGNGTSYELPDSNGALPEGRWPANVVHDGSAEVVARPIQGFARNTEGSAAVLSRHNNHVWGLAFRR